MVSVMSRPWVLLRIVRGGTSAHWRTLLTGNPAGEHSRRQPGSSSRRYGNTATAIARFRRRLATSRSIRTRVEPLVVGGHHAGREPLLKCAAAVAPIDLAEAHDLVDHVVQPV